MIFDLIPYLFLAVIVLLLVAAIIPTSPEENLRQFRQQCREQGVSFEETQAAIGIRVAFVRLRAMSSDFCREKGSIRRSDINEFAGFLAGGIAAAHGVEAAKSFIGWVDSSPNDEILYDDARAIMHQKTIEELRQVELPPPSAAMSKHLSDAFRIVK